MALTDGLKLVKTCVPLQFSPRPDTLSPHSSNFLAQKTRLYRFSVPIFGNLLALLRLVASP